MRRPWFLDWAELKGTLRSPHFWAGFWDVFGVGLARPKFGTSLPKYIVESNGKTVWVNGPCGLVGRFSQFGIDVHRDPALSDGEGGECLHCTHERPTRNDWIVFKSLMLCFYGIEIPNEHTPDFILEDAGLTILKETEAQ